MNSHPRSVLEYWRRVFSAGEAVATGDDHRITISADLNHERRVMLLENLSGRVQTALSPEMAERMELRHGQHLSVAALRRLLSSSGLVLHGPDWLFYLPEEVRAFLERPIQAVRQLTAEDRPAFNIFRSQGSEQDLEDASVELDHWAAFGAFDEDQLVCAASMYPWDGARIADVGVLTLPKYRRQGHGRAVLGAISRLARDRGYEPQYRCQLGNKASAALACRCGFTLFGKWEVIDSAASE